MKITELPNNKKIILFDGVCNLCDSSVQFIIRHDSNDVFRFVSLQSELGIQIVNHVGVDLTKIDSILFYESEVAYYYKSEAVLRIAQSLGGIFKCLGFFSILPTRFLNLVYDFIAKNRYKWFGKNESCMIPTPELQSKFLA